MKIDWDIMLKNAIYGKQEAYKKYKEAAIDALKYTFIGSEGEMVIEEGQAERNQKAMDCWKEVMRLDYEIKRFRNEVERCS